MFNWVISKLIVAYLYSTLVFLLLRLLSGQVRSRTTGYLQAANVLLFLLLLLNLSGAIIGAVQCTTCYGRPFYLNLLNTFLLGFAFHLWILSRKLRPSVGYTVVSMILLFLYLNPLRLDILVNAAFRDYQPSIWSVYYIPSEKYVSILMSTVYFWMCWLWSGWRKLSRASS